MTFGSGGTVVGQARYEVTLDAQQMAQSMAQLEQTSRAQSQQISQGIQGIEKSHQALASTSSATAITIQREMRSIESSVTQLSPAFAEASSHMSRMAAAAGEIGPAGLAITAAGVAVVGMVAALKEGVDASANFGKETLKLQGLMGGSIETASSFVAVFDRFGIGSTTSAAAMRTLSAAIVGVDEATGAASTTTLTGRAALEKLHIELNDVNGVAKNTSEVFLEVVDALNKQGAGFLSNREGTALLGRGFAELTPIVALGADGFNKLAEEAKTYGLTLTEQNMGSVKQYIDGQRDLDDANKGMRVQLGLLIDGPLGQMESAVAKAAGAITNTMVPAIKSMQDAASKAAGELANLILTMRAGTDFKPDLGPNLGNLNVHPLTGGPVTAAGFSAGEAMAGAPALPGVALTPEQQAVADQKRAASNKQIEKDLEEGLKKRDEAVKDEAQREIDTLHEQEKANQTSYDASLKAYQGFKDEATKANEKAHTAALATLKVEEDAMKASYDQQIKDAQAAQGERTRLNESTHKSALEGIAAEKLADQDLSKGHIADIEQDRDAALQAIQVTKDTNLASLTALEEKQKTTRQTEDQVLRTSRQKEDQDAQNAHQGDLDRMKEAHDVAQQGFKDQRDGIEATKKAAIDAIDDEIAKNTVAHDQALTHIQAEHDADQARHDQANRALDDRGRALQDQHDAALAAIQDETQADEQASQARQAALKAQGDELDRQHQLRMADIDAEAKAQTAALQAQVSALDAQKQAAAFAAQIAPLQANVAQAETGVQIAQEISQTTGDPNTVIAARKALADAQAALDKANADRQTQIAKDALQDQIADVRDQTDAKKKAEADQYQAAHDRVQAEIADDQHQLQVAKQALQDRTTAENAAFKTRTDEIAAEKRANDDRLTAELANLTKEKNAEDERQKQFTAAETVKRRTAEDTASKALAGITKQTETENKAYADSVTGSNRKYTADQQNIANTRLADDQRIAAGRLHEDQDNTTHRKAIEDTATHDAKVVTDLYNTPRTGLIDVAKNAEFELEKDLDARKIKVDTTYADEQEQIRLTFTDDKVGLIPKLEAARTAQETQYALRRTDIDTTYNLEKTHIYDTFDNPNPPDGKGGLIPKLTAAYDATKQTLGDQVIEWQKWQTKVSGEIKTATENLQGLIDKAAELNSIGDTQVREGPQPVGGEAAGNQGGETSEQRKARENAENQAAIDKSRAESGGRGMYGGAPLSVAQFGPGSAALRTEFGNSSVDAMCGPIAAEALMRLGGNPQDFSSILAWAKSNGYWNPSDGITAGGFGPIAQHFGINTSVTGNEQSAISALSQGEPVVINTAHHYMLAQGYDAASGLFDLGYTGETVYGQRYMTFDQLSARGGGFRNFYVADGVSMFGGGSAPAKTPATTMISVPSLGVNFSVATPFAGAHPTAPGQLSGAANPSPSSQDIINYIRLDAAARHIDPQVALTVARSEGGTSEAAKRGTFDTGSSWWPFQLHYGGPGYEQFGTVAGLGTSFSKLTGFAPGDPAAWQASVDYALDIASKSGWGQWFGAAAAGISNFQGIGVPGFSAGGIIPEPTDLVSQRTGRRYAVAGEVGPERVAAMNEAGRTGGPVEHFNPVHNWYGVTPESVVAQMQTAVRRERLLRGR